MNMKKVRILVGISFLFGYSVHKQGCIYLKRIDRSYHIKNNEFLDFRNLQACKCITDHKTDRSVLKQCDGVTNKSVLRRCFDP